MYLRKHYRTIVLSDIHLGTTHSKVQEVSDFLRKVNCDRLILNGDIIDGWHIKKNGTRRWQPKHTQFFKVLMKIQYKMLITSMAGIIELKAIIVTLKNLKGYINIELTII